MNQNIKKLSDCVNTVNDQIQVNINGISGSTLSTNSGDVDNGTQRITIADNDTNISSIKTNLDELYACVDHVNKHIEVDTNAINGIILAVNSGTNDNGTQRVCISTDDVNLKKISDCINTTTTNKIRSQIVDNTGNAVNVTSNALNTYISAQASNLTVALKDGSGNNITSSTNALDVNLKSTNLSNQTINLNQINSTAVSNFLGSGTSTNSLRVNLASDDLLLSQYKIYPSVGARENSTIINPVCLHGKSSVITSTEWCSIANSNGTMTYPRFGMNKNKTLSLISTDTDDVNTTGNGAWQVTVEGYNFSTGALVTEVVNLNGTTAVNTSSSFYGIRRIYCTSWGTSTHYNQGTIYIYDPAAGLTTSIPNSIITLIPAGENYSAGPIFLSYHNKYLYPMFISITNYGTTNVELAVMDVSPTGYADFQGNAWAIQQNINPVIYIVVYAGQAININLESSPRFFRGASAGNLNYLHVMAKSLSGTGNISYCLTLIEK